ncbi:MAG: hypothetical protein GEV08_17215 [Acidimicrobiia bacterium]|nr:hypothetical protein [Acidimicrobiia bacterium]
MAGDDLEALAWALVALGVEVRDAVRGSTSARDGRVVRSEGGDDVFGIDDRADVVLRRGLDVIGRRWPGEVVMEGLDEPVRIGRSSGARGPWRFLVDPLDGTRPLLAGKRSAWVLVGAGREARTLEELELSVVVEVPTDRSALGLVAWATRDGRLEAEDHDLWGGGPARAVRLVPRPGADIEHSFVTVVRFAPGFGGAIGAWADRHLAGLTVFDDLVPCTAGQMLGLASGADAAVFDPRPHLAPGAMAAHPYDLAGLWVARAAGAVVEALPAGPLDVPLDVTTPVAWQGFANDAVAARLRACGPLVL